MLRPRLHFVSSMRRNCWTRAWRGAARTKRRREEENLVLVQTKTVPVCKTVTAYIYWYVTYLWCTRTFGVNLMSEKLPHHRLFPLLSSPVRSLDLSLFLPLFLSTDSRNVRLILSWSIYLSISYLPREIHSRFLRSLFSLSSVRLLAFSQPFQWWFSRVAGRKEPRSADSCALARYSSSFSLFSKESRHLRPCGIRKRIFFFSLVPQ